jgi:hypothetical protein
MWKRLLQVLVLATFPMILAGCPGEDDTIGEEIEEGLEEIEDEIDDAL